MILEDRDIVPKMNAVNFIWVVDIGYPEKEMYIHERKEWPQFIWNQKRLSGLLAETSHLQGRLLGRMEALVFHLREEATLQTLTLDVIKTSEI